jgi:modulator of FtsH protease HflC
MNRTFSLILAVIVVVLGVSSAFQVNETESAIKFQLGRIVSSDYTPGLHFKLPFINNVRKFDNRILTLDTPSESMLTSEQKYVNVDSFVKWRITDVAKFYISTQGNEVRALSRLEQIIKDRIRAQIASRTLVEVVSQERVNIMRDIQVAANDATSKEFGIEVIDVRIKSIELPEDVRESVFRRMATDRQKEANLLRFQGREEAERVRANADREVQVLLAEAERDGQIIRGAGDSASIEIYAAAYSKDEEFFAFYRSLEAYQAAFEGNKDVLVIDPSSSFFDYFGSDSGRKD